MEEVKLVLKPAYNQRRINKEQYKEILRKAVPKVRHFQRFCFYAHVNVILKIAYFTYVTYI